jgi:hypothetical protein
MYIRAKDPPKLLRWYRPPFRTKLEMAADLVTWAAKALAFLRRTLWVVVDAKRPFLLACAKAGVIVVGRLRCDVASQGSKQLCINAAVN